MRACSRRGLEPPSQDCQRLHGQDRQERWRGYGGRQEAIHGALQEGCGEALGETGEEVVNAYKILRTHWLTQVRAARMEYRVGVGSFSAYYAMVKRLVALRARRTSLNALR